MLQKLVNWFKRQVKAIIPQKTIKKALDINLNVDEQMFNYTEQWFNIFSNKQWDNLDSIGLAVTSTNFVSTLVNNELKLETVGGKKAELINNTIQKYIIPNVKEQTQLALVGGQVVIKPYIKNNELAVQFINSSNFLPIEYDSTGTLTSAVFVDEAIQNDKHYIRFEYHKLNQNNTYTVLNYAFEYNKQNQQLGVMIDLNNVDKWKELLHEQTIENIDFPLFAVLKTPFANNISVGSCFPISFYANAVDTLKRIDEFYTEYNKEFRKSRKKMFLDSTLIQRDEKGQVANLPYNELEDYFLINSSDNNLIHEFNPAIREVEYGNGLNKQIRIFEHKVNLSSGTFTFDPKTGNITATQVISDDRTTYNTVKAIQTKFSTGYKQLVNILDVYATLYNLAPTGKVETVIEWGDSVFEDTESELRHKKELLTLGIISKAELRSWYTGESLEEAEQKINLFKSDMFFNGEI